MRDFFQDLRLAFRSLASRPAFTIPALLTLAGALGAGTAVFSVVDGVLLRPLPYPEPGRLVELQEVRLEDDSRQGVSPPNLNDWQRGASSLQLSLVSSASLVIVDEGRPRRVPAVEVSPDFFQMLGVGPVLGPGFTTSAAESRPEAVISHDFWSRRFGSDPQAVGQVLEAVDRRLTIVGVLPADFYFPEQADFWMPRVLGPDQLTPGLRYARYLTVLGRLQPGYSLETALDEVRSLTHAASLNPGWDVVAVPQHQQLVQPVERTLWILLGAVALVLLIACTNVTQLLLSRGLMRGRELAMRAALGAGRLRLVRLLLTETLVLFAVAGALGSVLAVWSVDALVALAPAGLPRVSTIRPDALIFGPGLMIALGAGVVFGLLPALKLSGERLFDGLRAGSGTAVGARSGGWQRRGLVAAEVALSAVLLVGAALLLQSLLRLQSVPLGFEARQAQSFSLLLPAGRYNGDDARAGFFEQLRRRLQALPEVVRVGAATNLPLSGSSMTFAYRLADDPEAAQEFGQFHTTTPGYFETMGIQLLEGRGFTDGDRSDSPPVVIVNETLARRYWPRGQAVGKRLSVVSRGGPVTREIVGVVGLVQHASLSARPVAELYVPYQQDPWQFMTVVFRSRPGAAALEAVQETVNALDPMLPLDNVGALQRLVDASAAPARFRTLVLGLFAVAALLIATVGIYGLIAFSVSQRTREIGIRMAIGADRLRILRHVVSRGLAVAGAGTAAGLLGAWWAVRTLESLLFEVAPSDTATFVAVGLALPALAVLASWLPARRAAALSVTDALRVE